MRTMFETPRNREQTEILLHSQGWQKIRSEKLSRPDADFEVWTKDEYPYQLRLSWPVDGDCNGATTTEIEIYRAMHFINDVREVG